MFSGRATTEVIASNQDLNALIFGFVHDKRRVWRTIVVVTPIRKKNFSQADFARRFEEARRDDLVGIDVFDRQNGIPCGVWLE
jgi:hypothetical protein